MNKKILVAGVGPLATEIANSLRGAQHEVVMASTGKNAQLLVYKEKLNTVVLDLDIKDHEGLLVLKYIRLSKPALRVVCYFVDNLVFKALELNAEDIRKLGAKDLFIAPFDMKSFVKSCTSSAGVYSWGGNNQNFNKSNAEKEQEQEQESTSVNIKDDLFFSLKIDEFQRENPSIFDGYLRLQSNKYLKIVNAGQLLSEERLKNYKDKGTTHLYFRIQDRANYIQYINETLKTMLKNRKVSDDVKVSLIKSLSEKYIEEIHTAGIKEELIEEGKKICDNIYKSLTNMKNLEKTLRNYHDYSLTEASHSFLVAFFSSVICKTLGWNSITCQSCVIMGSFLHDVGKLKIPKLILNLKEENMNDVQKQIFQSHCDLGIELLMNNPQIPRAVLQIIHQHHERLDGFGYPQQLSGMKIFPLAKLVSMVDCFVSDMVNNKSTPKETINIFLKDEVKLKSFESKFLKAFIHSLIDKKGVYFQ